MSAAPAGAAAGAPRRSLRLLLLPLAIVLAGTAFVLLRPVSEERMCSPGAAATLARIAQVESDILPAYFRRDPMRACVTELATPRSEEVSRVLVLRSTHDCGAFCPTEIWVDHRQGGLLPAAPGAFETRGTLRPDRSAAVPNLVFDAATPEGVRRVRLVYSHMASLYLPIDRGAAPDPPDLAPMRFTPFRTRAGRALLAEGDITGNTVFSFMKALGEHAIARGSTLYLDSGGGDSRGSLALGRAIRRAGLSTDVARAGFEDDSQELETAACLSGCAFAYLGGVERRLRPGSRLGFHGPVNIYGRIGGDYRAARVALNGPEAFVYNMQLRAYLQDVGLNIDLADRILAIGYASLCSLSRRELSAWRIVGSALAGPGARPAADPLDCWPSDQPAPDVSDETADDR